MTQQDEWQARCVYRVAHPGNQGRNKVDRAMARCLLCYSAEFIKLSGWKPDCVEFGSDNEAAKPVGEKSGCVAVGPGVAGLSVEHEQNHLGLTTRRTVGVQVELGSRDVHRLVCTPGQTQNQQRRKPNCWSDHRSGLA